MSNNVDFQRLSAIIQELRRLGLDSGSSANQVDQQLTSARSIIHLLDQTALLQRVAGVDVQVLIVSRLQDLAYHDPDSGGIRDIAQWCVSHWLRLLQQNREDVGVLQGLYHITSFERPENPNPKTGLGQAWLLRSQTSLAGIQSEEGNSSSGMYDYCPRSTSNDFLDEEADYTLATTEANSRRHTADYVEARGTLIPATEYLTRAVNIAERDGVLQGQLLSLVRLSCFFHGQGIRAYHLLQAAEAYMSLGNVSYAPGNEQYFRQALLYLRRASQIPGYTITPYLRR